MRYERTGEFRAPREGEWYEEGRCSAPRLHYQHYRHPRQARDTWPEVWGKRWILREVGETKAARPPESDVLAVLEQNKSGQLRPEFDEALRRVRVVGRLETEIEAAKRAQIFVPEWVEHILKGEGV